MRQSIIFPWGAADMPLSGVRKTSPSGEAGGILQSAWFEGDTGMADKIETGGLRRMSRVCGVVSALVLMAQPLAAQMAGGSGQGAQKPREVGVITAERQEVPRSYVLPGRAVAYEQADIRPRLTGVVTAILYEPGKPITRGTPMFQLDDTSARADLRAAQAAVGSARAEVNVSRSALDRAERLVGSGVTQADLETARAGYEKAEAALQSAEAALELAEIELGWTTVASPINGVSGLAQVSVGDLVTASQSDAMAIVTRLDPIEVDMFEPSARMLQIRDEIESGRIRAAEQLNLSLTLENGATYASKGQLVASGNQVSTTTGTIEYRFRVENPDGRILPGMFLRGELEIGRVEGILVPQMITTRDRAGELTVWLAQEGKAVRRRITADGSHQNAWVVVQGLEGGEQLIVDGITNLREGADVAPVPVRIDENGVVRDAATAPQSE